MSKITGIAVGLVTLLFPALGNAQVTELPAGPYGGMFRDESTGKIWLDIDSIRASSFSRSAALLASTPFRIATTADIQPLLQIAIIHSPIIGPYLECPMPPGELKCKFAIFDDSATGSMPQNPGKAGASLSDNTVTVDNDAVSDATAALFGIWAVQRAPALRANSNPFSSDMDGDGIDEKIVWRPSSGTWFIHFSASNEVLAEQWGLPGDIPLFGDYTGDHIPDLVVWRPSTGTWYVKTSSSLFDASQSVTQQFGLPGDVPIRGDYDNDGILDYAVWRPSQGNWFVLRSSTHQAIVEQWGLPGDVPVTGARVPQ